MDYEQFLIVVRNEDETQERELDLANATPIGQLIEIGKAVVAMIDESDDGDVTITVSTYAK